MGIAILCPEPLTGNGSISHRARLQRLWCTTGLRHQDPCPAKTDSIPHEGRIAVNIGDSFAPCRQCILPIRQLWTLRYPPSYATFLGEIVFSSAVKVDIEPFYHLHIIVFVCNSMSTYDTLTIPTSCSNFPLFLSDLFQFESFVGPSR